MKPCLKVSQWVLKANKTKLSRVFRGIRFEFDGEVTKLHFYEDKTIEIRIKLNPYIDINRQINSIKSEIARYFQIEETKIIIENEKR